MGSGVGWDPGRLGKQGRFYALARLIRIEHTLFSLPFAYAGALLADVRAALEPRVLLLIGLAVVGLRTAAMAYNNIADMDVDALNPRTRMRPLVTGAVSVRDAWMLVVLGSILYYISAALLNVFALLLSPLLWIIAITYPHAKRWHWLPHLHLGLVLGLVVFGGAVASYGMVASGFDELLSRIPWLYVVAVTLWVSGFDTYYSIMDMEFDRRVGLGSIPARFGASAALMISRVQHILAALFFVLSTVVYGLGLTAMTSTMVGVLLLAYQHYILARYGLDGSSIARAFNLNLALGVVVSLGLVADKLLHTL